MERRDKINALWMNLETTLNALEEMGEDVHTTVNARVVGTSARVVWDMDRERWEAEKLT